MADSIKTKTVHGVIWSALERFSLQGVQFLINIVMARLLLPSDYGLIAMLAIFLQISQAFVDSGFTNALIQRKDRNEVDFSTVFYFNIVIAVVFYLILFVAAPWIADFYHMPALVAVTRVIALNLIISALSAVHKTKLTIAIDFKTQAKASFTAAVVSGVMGIWMAYTGWGVWSLVVQTLMNALFLTLLPYYFLRWRPLLVFSVSSFRRLFAFGSKLLVSGLIHTIYYNLYVLVIGRKFSARELGFYTRAEQFAIFPSSNLNAVISRVTFPILSSIQDDTDRLADVYRKYIRLASFIIFPLMMGLAALAKPVIVLLLTEKWVGAVVLLQILCFDWMFDHLSVINLNLLYVKGRSDLALRLEVVKKVIATVILFSSVPFGLVGMCWGRVLYSLIATYLNTYYTKSLIGLSLGKQVRDIAPYWLLAFAMGGVVVGASSLCDLLWLQLVAGIAVGIVFYLGSIYVLKLSVYRELRALIK